MATDLLKMIAMQVEAIRQQSEALLMLVESFQPASGSSDGTDTPSGAPQRQRQYRSFDDDGATVARSAPVPDTTGDLRPPSST
jgi:hypothetical protein